MVKYPSIEQLKNVITAVRKGSDHKGKDSDGNAIYEHTENYPTLKFKGTVKLHGTNSAIVKYSCGRIVYQSRERELSVENDNAGFMSEMSKKKLDFLFEGIEFSEHIAVFGEWCGGSIQKGVAINKLPKMFVIFGIKVDGNWIELSDSLKDESQQIYNILQFQTYEVEIDFNYPERSQDKIVDMTIEVENCCPVGKHFGVEGIGEGIVFTCVDNQDYKFKSKGEKHSASKVAKLNPINTEAVSGINEFIEYAVTENRLQQGLSYFKENNIEPISKNTGMFISWIVKDVLKEESDTIEKNGLNQKMVNNAIVTKARVWFLNQV